MNGTFEQLRAAVCGQAVGDALGVPYEFMPRDTFRCEGMTGYGTHNQPIGTWSDDTSMMLATLDSLIANEWQVNTEDMRERYLAWLSNGEYAIDGRVFDCGRTVSIALQQRVGLSGERDNGNGSLMRIMPLAFADASADDVRAASAITHAHAISMEACSSMVDVLRDGLIKGIWPQELDDEPLRGMPRDEVGSSGFVKDTYEAALWCLANTDDYASCVLAAVNLGDDTDTRPPPSPDTWPASNMDSMPFPLSGWRYCAGVSLLRMCLDGRSRRGIKALAVSSNLLFPYAMKMASTPPSTVRTPCLLFSTITPKHWTLPCLVPLNIAENSLLLDAHHRIPLARRPDCFGRGCAASGGQRLRRIRVRIV